MVKRVILVRICSTYGISMPRTTIVLTVQAILYEDIMTIEINISLVFFLNGLLNIILTNGIL